MKKLILISVIIMAIVFTSCAQNIPYVMGDGWWQHYPDTEKLMEVVDYVFIGKVTGIKFIIVDHVTGIPASLEESNNVGLYTIYEVDVITTYKGETSKISSFSIDGGIKDYRAKEQYELMKKYKAEFWEWGIPVHNNHPEYQIGEIYLFALIRLVDTLPPTVINLNQSGYTLDDPTNHAIEGKRGISPQSIISYFGEEKWDAFYTEWQKSDSIYKTKASE